MIRLAIILSEIQIIIILVFRLFIRRNARYAVEKFKQDISIKDGALIYQEKIRESCGE